MFGLPRAFLVRILPALYFCSVFVNLFLCYEVCLQDGGGHPGLANNSIRCPKAAMYLFIYYAPSKKRGYNALHLSVRRLFLCPSVRPFVLYNLVRSINRVWLGLVFSNFIQTLVIESRCSLSILGFIG